MTGAIREFYVGFYRPYLRNAEGRFDIRGIFGHCEIWGFTDDATWLFFDPQAHGMITRVTHHHDDVQAAISFRVNLCDTILRVPGRDPAFRLPFIGIMTCASVIGAMLGCRALIPSSLKRRLLRNGAEIVHEAAPRRSGSRR